MTVNRATTSSPQNSAADPSYPTGKYRQVQQLRDQGKLRQAEAVLLDIIKAYPQSATAYQLLADVEQELGHLPRALLALQEWLNHEPRNAAAWRRLGALQGTLGKWDEAVAAYRRAVELQPDAAANWLGLAQSAISAQKLDEAQAATDHLVDYFPKQSQSHVINGDMHKIVGDMAAAISAYQRALELNPDLSAALYSLVDITTPAPDEPLAKHIEALSQREDINDTDKAKLEFALGRIHDKVNHCETAWLHYNNANTASVREMRRLGITYEPQRVAEHTRRILSSYPAACFKHTIEPLPIDLKLIFIVGLPRSGTTLIEQILSSHPKVVAGGELAIAHNCHPQYIKRRNKLNMGACFDIANQDEVALLLQTREHYLDSLFDRQLDGEYIVDKMPANFKYLGFIRLLFPEAIIIHSQRDPLASCWSLYTSNFNMHEPYCNSIEHLAHYCRIYQKFMRHWRTVLTPPPIEIHYEDMVTRTEDVVRQLLSAIGLPWDDKCLAFHNTMRPVLTASYQQVRQPIYTASIDKWRRYEKYLVKLVQLLQTA